MNDGEIQADQADQVIDLWSVQPCDCRTRHVEKDIWCLVKEGRFRCLASTLLASPWPDDPSPIWSLLKKVRPDTYRKWRRLSRKCSPDRRALCAALCVAGEKDVITFEYEDPFEHEREGGEPYEVILDTE